MRGCDAFRSVTTQPDCGAFADARPMHCSLSRLCASSFAHLAFDELLKLIRLAWRRQLEGNNDMSGLGKAIGKPEARRPFCDVAQEDNALAVCGSGDGVIDDISFVV